MKTLGIITTTFNRAYCLHRIYESLLRQANSDFMWFVVDDGSTDDTHSLINGYIAEGKIDITYLYQKNGGMTSARNLAYDKINTQINTIIDSDDWLEDDAVSTIIEFWNKNKNDNVAGIIALNRKVDGDSSGGKLPVDVKQCTLTVLHDKHKCTGDKKLIYRSAVSRKYPYPSFENEKSFPASYKFRLIDLSYEMLLLNKTVCVVDFNETGQTFNRINQYKKCPKGYAFYRNEMMRISNDPKYIIKQAIHYISSSKFAGNKSYINDSSKKFYVILCLPLGLIFHEYLKRTKRTSLGYKRKK